jgi:hypothetical protein
MKQGTPLFFGAMCDHYELRLQDKSLPLHVRSYFRKSLAMYKAAYLLAVQPLQTII